LNDVQTSRVLPSKDIFPVFGVSLLQQAKIDIEINATVANTQLSQTFVNQIEDIIEAVYYFIIRLN
jgi:hypothetical protein